MSRRALLSALLLAPAASRADALTDGALAAFRDYEARAARIDPALADLYADDARIVSRRLMPDGTSRSLSFRGAEWKALIRQAMPAAQQRGDTNSFRAPRATAQGPDLVRIEAERFNHLKRYASPFALLLRRDARGTWRIVDEYSETRP
jgi:hypothetical protein